MATEFFANVFSLKLRAARRTARSRVLEGRKLLRRSKRSLGPENREAVLAALQATADSLRGTNADMILSTSERLNELLDKYLNTFRKPAWRESVESVTFAVLVALMLRSFVVEAFKIPSGSMIPSLAIGDQIFVNKFLYGIRIPFTSVRLIDFAAPKRGDVIVFICPEPPNEDYIKRVVGLQGDQIRVRNGVVSINDEPIVREPLGPLTEWDRDNRGDGWHAFTASAFREHVGDHTFRVLQDADSGRSAPDFGPYTVPPGHVWMMGDNRDHSYDSRAWGPVPINNILGRSMFVWWSWGHDGLNLSRLGSWID